MEVLFRLACFFCVFLFARFIMIVQRNKGSFLKIEFASLIKFIFFVFTGMFFDEKCCVY